MSRSDSAFGFAFVKMDGLPASIAIVLSALPAEFQVLAARRIHSLFGDDLQGYTHKLRERCTR